MGIPNCARVFVVLLALLVSCSSGEPFSPVAGPFSGDLVVDGTAVGTFSLTMQDSLVAGTGTLTHQGNTHPISISGNRTGKTFSGTLSNVDFGSGNITGVFDDADSCHGGFNYADNAQTGTIAGTWTADAGV